MTLRTAWVPALVVALVAWQGCRGGRPDGSDGSPPQGESPTPRESRPAGPAGSDGAVGRRAPEKLIEIDLSRQRLMTYEDGRLLREMTVSTGRRGKTPTGDFRIWRKCRVKDMKVGLPARGDYDVLEDVPWVMYFFNEENPKQRGLAIHGTWWHADFGKPVSHGCVTLSVEDARELFFWTDPPVGPFGEVTATRPTAGTRVDIFESAVRDGS